MGFYMFTIIFVIKIVIFYAKLSEIIEEKGKIIKLEYYYYVNLFSGHTK